MRQSLKDSVQGCESGFRSRFCPLPSIVLPSSFCLCYEVVFKVLPVVRTNRSVRPLECGFHVPSARISPSLTLFGPPTAYIAGAAANGRQQPAAFIPSCPHPLLRGWGVRGESRERVASARADPAPHAKALARKQSRPFAPRKKRPFAERKATIWKLFGADSSPPGNAISHMGWPIARGIYVLNLDCLYVVWLAA